MDQEKDEKLGLEDVDWSQLPAPEEDGAVVHLPGRRVPSVALAATGGGVVDLAAVPGRVVVFVYPMTGVPGEALPEGWDMIPGARGCTPQACAFRDLYSELAAAGVSAVFGLSTQAPEAQAEAAARLHLPFPLLSDAGLVFGDGLGLPRFEAGGAVRLKRVSLVVDDGVITQVFYPIFPPDQNAEIVLDWVRGAA